MNTDYRKYLKLLAEKYPSQQAVCREIINLNAILNLPKGTEHFMSDLHGEYEAFYHIVNNCSGVIREKIQMIFEDEMTEAERRDLATLVYYPRRKMALLKRQGKITDEWYLMTLNRLISIARFLSGKYTRSKVRKAMSPDFAYIIDELLHMQADEDNNQVAYHREILHTIIALKNAEEFVIALSSLIKRLAVDHLHIVGDIFDRGPSADKIMDLLMGYHSLDIEWGNHDILWMGAACGSGVCVANVLRNNLRHGNMEILESRYGINLRKLVLFALEQYRETDPIKAALRAISVIAYKLEDRVIRENPGFGMDQMRLFSRCDFRNYSVEIEGKTYPLNCRDFPTVDPDDPTKLSEEEKIILDGLADDFSGSKRLQAHVEFLYEKGSIYRVFNDNVLYHGCIPMDSEGNLDGICLEGNVYRGRSYMDYADRIARRAYYRTRDPKSGKDFSQQDHERDLDFMYFLWAGPKSPLCGRRLATFQREFIDDRSTWEEPTDPYYNFSLDQRYCNMIMREFGVYSPMGHIINGHTPVKTIRGEKPVRGGGKLYVIDGGFCAGMHKTTGIAGYTMIYNSHGIRLKEHRPFMGIEDALANNDDIESSSEVIEKEQQRVMVRDTDIGRGIALDIEDLTSLLEMYRRGEIAERSL